MRGNHKAPQFARGKWSLRLAAGLIAGLLALAAAARAADAPLPMFASSTYGSHRSAERAFDGDPASDWASYKLEWNRGRPVWLQASFDKPTTITQMTILWGKEPAGEFEVQAGPDTKQFKTIHSEKKGRGGRTEVRGFPPKCRFIKIVCIRAATPVQDMVSIAEVTFADPKLNENLRRRAADAKQKRRELEEGERRENAKPLLAHGVRELIFAARPTVKEHWYANIGYYAASDIPMPTNFLTPTLTRDGGKLYRYHLESGKLTAILDDPKGNVRDPQVDYDGQKILFSYRKGGSPYYHLYQINSDGTGLKQLTDGPFDDIEPTRLPDGGIAFVSTRCKRWVNCWMTHVAVIYHCDGDGKNIRQISANTEQDNTPWPLPDGRLLYMRWEYVDRSQVHYHHLWTMNPDGTGQTVYYGNQTSGTLMIDAKPIPGSDKVVASFSPGHGREEHKGYVAIVDPKKGPDNRAGARHVSKYSDYQDPWAFSEDCILAAINDQIVLFNGKDMPGLVLRLPDEDALAGLEIHEPRPLLPRPRERVIPARVDLATSSGQMLLANVYEGRNMGGVKPGEIKKLLVLESLPMPIHYSGGMEPITQGGSFTLERILGTVPVAPDGSAYFEVPAVRSVFFVALDEKDLSVKRMQSFTSVEPGETLGCVGCHEQRVKTTLPKSYKLMAFEKPPSKIEPIRDVPEVFDFPRDIQPILDRHCLKCHGLEQRKGGVNLTGDHGPVYSHSYTALTFQRQVADGRNRPQSNYPPRALGSSASPLLKKLEPSHHGVRASDHEKKMVRLWIESGAPYPGTYAALGSGMVGGYEQNQQDRRVATLESSKAQGHAIQQRCGECHRNEGRRLPENLCADTRGQFSRHVVYNLTRPEKSLMLLAPLAQAAGGLGICQKTVKVNGQGTTQTAVFTSTADPDYQKILGGITGAKAWLDRRKRFDEPGFLPRPEWTREMIRYGILPPTTDPNQPIDVYAAERKYWESLWCKP